MPVTPKSNRKYRKALEELRMTQRGAARFLDIDERTSRRYFAGHLEVPTSVTMLLTLMLEKQFTPEGVRGLAGFTIEEYGDMRQSASKRIAEVTARRSRS
jgi:hypothetical protein